MSLTGPMKYSEQSKVESISFLNKQHNRRQPIDGSSWYQAAGSHHRLMVAAIRTINKTNAEQHNNKNTFSFPPLGPTQKYHWRHVDQSRHAYSIPFNGGRHIAGRYNRPCSWPITFPQKKLSFKIFKVISDDSMTVISANPF